MKKRILVVDDDANLQYLLRELLEDEGYEVDTASDGLSAWKKLVIRREVYELLLLDGVMPRMNGLELIQILRWQKEISIPPLVMLSADDETLQRAGQMNIGHVVAKPFDLEKLLALLSDVLNEQINTGLPLPTLSKARN